MSTKCCAQLLVNVKILTIFCMVSSDWTTRGSSDLLQNWTHQFTRNMICFYPFDFIMQGKLIILRSRCFLHQNTSQSGMHSVVRLKKKRGGKAIIRTPKSATAQETTNVLVYVRKLHLLQTRKMTNPFTTIVRMQKNQPKPKTTFPLNFFLMAVLNYSVVLASDLFCCLLTTPFEEKPFAFLLYISFEESISYRVYSRVNNF